MNSQNGGITVAPGSFSRIWDEIPAQLVRLVGSSVRITLEIEAETPGDALHNVAQTVTENGSNTEVHGKWRFREGTMKSRKKVKVDYDIAEDSPSQKLNMTDETRERLLEIATEEADNLFEGAEGLWVSKGELPESPSDLSEDEYERFFTPERLEEIDAGQQITEDEFLALREARLQRLLDSSTDADVTTGYSFVEVVDDEDNVGIAVFLCSGYSFSGLDISVLDVFDTREDALAYLNENGWTGEG